MEILYDKNPSVATNKVKIFGSFVLYLGSLPYQFYKE